MSYQRKRSVSVNDRGHVVGQDHHRSRISNHDVDLVRELRAGGMKVGVIAAKFEMSEASVSYYCSGKRRSQLEVDQKFVTQRERRFRPARGSDFGDEFT